MIFYLKSVLELSAAGLKENIPKSVQSDDTSLSKGTNDDAELSIANNCLDSHRISNRNGEHEHTITNDKRVPDYSSKTKRRTDRFKRAPVFMDSGYGSRLSAVSELARDMALQRLFGNVGPGKRSTKIHHKQPIYSPFQMLTKRDHGYGSRVRAGHNIVNTQLARKNLFGAYGPGRKRNNENFNANFLDEQLDSEPLNANSFGQSKESENSNRNAGLTAKYSEHDGPTIFRAFRNPWSVYETKPSSNDVALDEGYRSRIEAADQLAHDLETKEKIFGKLGPGKK